MREIKFRAWDVKHSMWHNGKMWLTCDIGFAEIKADENIIVMQYTGLKDINKTEIYGHDIILINNRKYQVVWGWGLYEFILIRDFEGAENEESLFVYDVASNGDVMGEVIGNSFENPELLRRV